MVRAQQRRNETKSEFRDVGVEAWPEVDIGANRSPFSTQSWGNLKPLGRYLARQLTIYHVKRESSPDLRLLITWTVRGNTFTLSEHNHHIFFISRRFEAK